MANDAQRARPSRLIWRTDDTGATWDLSGHFWATVRQGGHDEHTVWSWMVIGYETQVLAAGQTGDLAAAKLLVEEWTDGCPAWPRPPCNPRSSGVYPAISTAVPQSSPAALAAAHGAIGAK